MLHDIRHLEVQVAVVYCKALYSQGELSVQICDTQSAKSGPMRKHKVLNSVRKVAGQQWPVEVSSPYLLDLRREERQPPRSRCAQKASAQAGQA